MFTDAGTSFASSASEDWTEVNGISFRGDCPDEIVAAITMDNPLLALGRQSGPRTRKVNIDVSRDLSENAETNRPKIGIDITHLLPTDEAVQIALMNATPVHSIEKETGRKFTNTFALIDMRPEAAVVFLLSAGSADMITEDRKQPAAEFLADCVRDLRPRLLMGKTFSRLFRESWGQQAFWIEVRALEEMGHRVLISDGEQGLWGEGVLVQANSLVKGEGTRREAKGIAANTRRTILRLTGTRTSMASGSAPYHLGSALPPGLTRFTMAEYGSGRRPKRIFFDSPAWYPDAKAVLEPLPNALSWDGQPADQVEILRWYLAHAGKPLWSKTALGVELVRRGYQTHSLRQRRGPNATYQPDESQAFSVVQRAILNNLDMYETGVLTRKVGGANVVISDIFPPDGNRWARPDDFDRIRAWAAHEARLADQRVGHTFTGLPVVVDGRTTSLVPMTTRSVPWPDKDPLRYNLPHPNRNLQKDTESRSGRRSPEPRRRTWLDHDLFAESILRAVASASVAPVPAMEVSETDPTLVVLRRAAQQAADKVQELTLKCEHLKADLHERKETGEHVMGKESREQGWIDHSEALADLDTWQKKVGPAERNLRSHIERQKRLQEGLQISKVLDVLASLRDPTDITYRALWLEVIRDLHVTHTQAPRRTATGARISWSFTLRITEGDTTIAVPVTGSHLIGAASQATPRAEGLIASLREGHTVRADRMRIEMVPDACEVLGRSPKNSAFMLGDNSALLRLTMKVLHPVAQTRADGTDRSDAKAWKHLRRDKDLVAMFARPDELAAHLIRVYNTPGVITRTRWLGHARPVESKALAYACQHGGAIGRADYGTDELHAVHTSTGRNGTQSAWQPVPGGLRLLPCCWCGGRILLVLRIVEVQGYVCWTCRLDRAGVQWAATDYDRYVGQPHEWALAGVTLETATPPTKLRSRPAGKRRQRRRFTPSLNRNPSAMSELEWSQFVHEYVDNLRPLSVLCRETGVEPDGAYAKLRELGLARPRKNRNGNPHDSQ